VATPFIIVSDVHLSHEGSASTADALVKLVQASAGQEIILAGDVFGLSSDPPSRDPVESVCTLLQGYPTLLAALRRHLGSGAGLTFLAGNHDAALSDERMRPALLAAFELTDETPLAIKPWFIRRGRVHVEHGHLWDPDNAPAHPLATWSVATEPLGIALTRRFVAKHKVWQFAHAHETTVAQGFQRAFQLFGARAPLLVLQYFAASSAICADTLFDRGLSAERASGARAIASVSEEAGVKEDALHELLQAAPIPTHTEFQRTFLRMYNDRVLALLGLCSGAACALSGALPLAAALTLASGGYLGLNVKKSGARYKNRPVRLLRNGAEIVRELTEAELVVFGHTHVPVTESGYANAGSFGYPATGSGRPYLIVSENGGAELRRSEG
jgi:UDP-2,3-diacylglucosamine pyrophosphatase LpxH